MRAARQIREAKGLTIKAVAEAIGIPAPTLSRYESGTGMREDSETAYAQYLETTVDDIRKHVTTEVPS